MRPTFEIRRIHEAASSIQIKRQNKQENAELEMTS